MEDVKAVRFSEAIPEGYQHLDGILSSHIFLSIVASGNFPVGKPSGLRTEGYLVKEGILMHDLNHVSAMMGDYKYMAQIREGARRLVELNLPESKFVDPISRRYEYFTEFLNLISPEQKTIVEARLNRIKNELQVKSLNDVNVEMLRERVTEGTAVAKELTELYEATQKGDFWTPLGGAIRLIEARYAETKDIKKMDEAAPRILFTRPDLRLKGKLLDRKLVNENGLGSPLFVQSLLMQMEKLVAVDRDQIFHALFSDLKGKSKELEELCRHQAIDYNACF